MGFWSIHFESVEYSTFREKQYVQYY